MVVEMGGVGGGWMWFGSGWAGGCAGAGAWSWLGEVGGWR